MNVSTWAIKRPLPALMVFFVLCVAGLWGFHQLPVARFPDIAFPMTTVTITQPGASPSQLETEVTRRVEDSVSAQIRFARRRRADAHGLVRHRNMQRVLVGVGIHRDGLDAHLAGGEDDATGDFAAVGDQYLVKHKRCSMTGFQAGAAEPALPGRRRRPGGGIRLHGVSREGGNS